MGTNTKRIPERDALIDEGLSPKEICVRVLNLNTGKIGVSGSAIRLYIKDTEQYDHYWKRRAEREKREREEERREPEEWNQPRRQFLSTLDGIIHKKIQDVGGIEASAYERVFQVSCSGRERRITNIPFENLYRMFYRYFEALESGKDISINELSESSDIALRSVGRNLKAVDLDTLCRPGSKRKQRVSTPDEVKQAIERSVGLDMSISDKAYLIGTEHWVVDKHYRKHELPRAKPPFLIKLGFGIPNFRTASKIYRVADIGFNEAEVSELLEFNPDIVEGALENRETIEAKIIHALYVLYPEQTHDKTYRN